MLEQKHPLFIVGEASDEIAPLVPFARHIANTMGNEILAVGLVSVPHNTSLSTGTLPARHLRQELHSCVHRVGARETICVGHNVWDELKRVIQKAGCSLVLLNSNNLPPAEHIRHLPCDLVFIKPSLPKKIRRILLPIRGGPYAALALRLALGFAEAFDAEITVLRAIAPGLRIGKSYQELVSHLNQLERVTRWIETQEDAAQAIIAQSAKHQLIVMGSIATPRLDDPVIGPTAARILDQARIPTIVVKAATLWQQSKTRPVEGEPVDYTISVVVDKWFAENTFHAHEFKDIQQLVELKEKQRLTISLGLPALNEEKTIGKIIRTMRRMFMERYPLLDEIVVIDSNSSDRTVEIAQQAGVPVVKHSEILAQYEVWAGKGEALWNSLYILRGDLVAWIDTDIVNIHPRFVYGILGPLIREPKLMYVKGFYQRPLKVGKKFEARGGGRVTELSARPLLNLFYPELSGFIQPLSGEYAGRRVALEQVPFVAGYGVEIGLLIDIWNRFGLAAMGQVDLEERIHRNQSLAALSKMSFEIIQVVLKRIGAERGVDLIDDLNKSIKLIRHTEDTFQLEVADIRIRERPPMITIPEYRERHGIRAFP